MRKVILGLCAGLALALLAPAGVFAQRDDDWYRDVRPFLDKNTGEGARRARLWERFIRLRSDVRTADRRGDISLKDADNFYNRLDKVGHFLRDDCDDQYRLNPVMIDLRHARDADQIW